MTPDNDDDALLDALRKTTSGSSAEHDATVLAAARKVAAARQRKKASPWWRPFAIGLPALAVVALISIPLLNETPAPPVDTVRSASVSVAPADGAVVAELDVFEWATVRGATEYRVIVRDEAATVVWTSDWSSETALSVADQDGLALAPGLYLWSVETDGGRQRELGPFTFDLAAPE
ncbi:MAG: hypothetical protein AAGH76_16225 [Pseudomonadota bacterium]